MDNFFRAITEDKELQDEILSAETEEEIYEIAQPYIGSMSFEEFCDNLYWEYENQDEIKHLSEEELINACGGVQNATSLYKIKSVIEHILPKQ